MRYSGLPEFLKSAKTVLGKGPVAMIFAEDEIELDTTLRHHLHLGFRAVLVFVVDLWDCPPDLEDKIHRITYNPNAENAVPKAVTAVNESVPNIWMYYCYNSEYLFYPFCETRAVAEMLAYHTEERRDSMLTYVVDLYAQDLNRHPNAVSLDDAFLDRSGYYALARNDPANHNHPKERQLNFYGGLRWRFEEHVPQERRKIDRIAIFRSKPGMSLRDDHTFSDEEYNTYACPWHNNLTASIASFRTAKALKSNPGSMFDINTFAWHNSVPFEWHSRQLLDLGLMEPGQWF